MGQVNNINREALLSLLTFEPGLKSIRLPPELRAVLVKGELNDLKIFYGDELKNYSEIFEPKLGFITVYTRTQVLSRLRDGTLAVAVPKTQFTFKGRTYTIPSAKFDVEHKRAYHQDVMHDDQRWTSNEPFVLDLDKKRKAELVCNLEVIARDCCSIYSDFLFRMPEPKDWQALRGEFNQYSEEKLNPFLSELNQNVNEMVIRGENPEDIQLFVDSESKKFMRDKTAFLERIITESDRVGYYFNSVFDWIRFNYAQLVHGRQFRYVYDRDKILVFDGDGQILFGNDLSPDRPLDSHDFFNKKTADIIEKFPFNGKFHSELQKMLEEPHHFKDYELNAFQNLALSYRLIEDKYFGDAIKRAFASFETVLDEFLIESRVMTRYEKEKSAFTFDQKLGEKFDEAVCKDTNYDKHEGIQNLFPEVLRTKIKRSRGQNQTKESTILDLRNRESHSNSWGYVGPNYQFATFGVMACEEAAKFIIYKCWNEKHPPAFCSDIARWAFPEMNGLVVGVDDDSVRELMKMELRRTLSYLDPREIEMIKKMKVPQNYWSASVLRKLD